VSTTITNHRASLRDGRGRGLFDPHGIGDKRRARRAQRHAARDALRRWQPDPVTPRHKCKGTAAPSRAMADAVADLLRLWGRA
jgi:hypothetical protein